MVIIGLSGSLRRGSYNSLLLRSAAAIAPAGTTIEIGSIRGIPLYDGDVEAESGIPPAVAELKEKLAAADGLLISTPEYNFSVPGVMKNAIDWLSRPPRDIKRVFGGLPVALMGTSAGRGGTALSQTAWLSVFRALMVRPWFGRTLQIPNAAKVFDDNGIVDEDTQTRLQRFVDEFAAFVEASGGRGPR